ncbi:MAG: lysine biosynthesis protein LysW [Planctomycetota bacterium]
MTKCPECEGDVPVPEDAMLGEIVPCAGCGAELEVTSVSPVVLEPAPEIEEDWGE